MATNWGSLVQGAAAAGAGSAGKSNLGTRIAQMFTNLNATKMGQEGSTQRTLMGQGYRPEEAPEGMTEPLGLEEAQKLIPKEGLPRGGQFQVKTKAGTYSVKSPKEMTDPELLEAATKMVFPMGGMESATDEQKAMMGNVFMALKKGDPSMIYGGLGPSEPEKPTERTTDGEGAQQRTAETAQTPKPGDMKPDPETLILQYMQMYPNKSREEVIAAMKRGGII